MRNHLISVAIGFVLGGLVLVPLAMHWRSSPSMDAPPGAAGSDAGALRAPTGFTDSVNTRRSPAGSRAAPDRHVASSPRSSSAARFVPPLRLPSLLPADARSMNGRTAWRGDGARRRADGLDGARAMTAARGVVRVRGIGDLDVATPQPFRHAILPMGFELREDLRSRHGMVASTLLAALPRAETTVITELPLLARLDDDPAAMLPPSIVPTSVRRTVELATPQTATDTITAAPVRATHRSPLAMASGGSAAPLTGTSTTIPYGPVIPYGPAIPATIGTIPSPTAASSAPTPSQPVANLSPVDPSATPAPPAPTPTTPTPTAPAPTLPMPTVPAVTPPVPAPTPPMPNAPTLPAPAPTLPMPTVPAATPPVPAPTPPMPNAPTLPAQASTLPPNAPGLAPYFPPGRSQFPGMRPFDLVAAPLPEGVEVVFGGSIPAGSGGTAGGVHGAVSLASYEIATGFGVDWEVFEATSFGEGHWGFSEGLNAAAVNAVPEPVTALFVIAGAAVLIGRRRSTHL